MNMFARKVYSQLLEWKRVSNGKSAALIEGARRVGKSTVAKAFAAAEYDDYLLIDFSDASPDVKSVFMEGIGDMDAFFRNLFVLTGKSLPAGHAAIIFDEVQLFPRARQAIKQLVADGRYHYIETGSLISIKENVKGILIPSEEHHIRMYPMDFEEFCWARGDEATCAAVRDAFEHIRPLGDAAHRKILRSFREYMAVGGMPQAVDAFVEGKTYGQIDFVKKDILALYQDDLHKFDSEQNGRVSAIFKTVPKQLGNQNMHFKFSEVERGARYDRLLSSLEFLSESMTVNVCENVTVPDPLMELYVQEGNFKMFMADTGLLVTAAVSAGVADESLYKALVFGKLGANLGMVTENAVAQMLVARGHALHFHEFKIQDDKARRPKRYEIDFLLLHGKKVCPVEVKSSNYRTHKSLDRLVEKYDLKFGERYVLYTKDLHREKDVLYIPLYMAFCL